MAGLIKERYTHIQFPLPQPGGDKLLLAYIEEFFEKNHSEFRNFVRMVLNVAHDFLRKKLTAQMVSQIAATTYHSRFTRRFHEAPYLWEHNELLAFLHELLDLPWMRESSSSEGYELYLEELKDRWGKLVKRYDTDFA